MITNVNFPDNGDHAEITVLIPRRADGSHNYAAAFASLTRAVSIQPVGYDATHHAELAIAAGQPATGGGASSQTTPLAYHVTDLTPAMQALADSQSDEPPLNGPDFPGEAAPVESQGGAD